jgi:hypothetical protein
VRPSQWTGSGPEFNLEWGGHPWALRLDAPGPGLCSRCDRWGLKLLSLFGLAQTGRFDPQAFSEATLINVERWRDRVQATFAPPGWGGLLVRASWGPDVRGEAIDLEIQASATSIGELRNFEVVILSQLPRRIGGPPILPAARVEARDLRAAALYYDGRESAVALGGLTSLRLAEAPSLGFRPQVFASPGGEPGLYYVEIAPSNDLARRISNEHLQPGSTAAGVISTRYALFGHDLEKGVVLRARIRALWLRSETPEADALCLYRQFLREPLPLGP